MKSALLILDMQYRCFEEPQPFEAELVVQRINRLSAWARKQHYPVIFLHYEHPQWLPYQSPAWQLVPGLKQQPEDITLRKNQANAFLDSELAATLNKLAIERLLVCGYASEFCVDSTVRHASGLGYQIVLISDAHTTKDKPHLLADKIRQHHNITLSQSPSIQLGESESLLHGRAF